MTINILMPALSPTMTEGKVAKWYKNVGDSIVAGDIIADIETDKATMELESIDDGVLGEILVNEGTASVSVNDVIGVILEEGDNNTATSLINSKFSEKTSGPKETRDDNRRSDQQKSDKILEKDPTEKRVFATPLARRIAHEVDLNLSEISGTGPNGRIIKLDVENAISVNKKSDAILHKVQSEPSLLPIAIPSFGKYTEKPNSTIRKIIAERLTASSRDIPSYSLTVDCELDNLMSMRADLNKRSPDGDLGYKISINDFLIRAIALTIRRVPEVNTAWSEEAILQYEDIDISVAVSTNDGLITPIIRKADQKGLSEISIEMVALADRARSNKLTPDEFQGGGFTISNLGMFGVKNFTSIINPPQSCIMSVGAGEQRPIVRDGKVVVATVMTSTLTSDHRTVDGALSAQFMREFKIMIEDPLTMLL
jgi:pyruvate dehydrogenase E2 component (dihydrolipoamide acetyltransferase)